MNILVFSDIHGSLEVTERLVSLASDLSPDCIAILGDILYHGPRNRLPERYDPKSVVALLEPFANRVVAVRGNCDAAVDELVLPFPLAANFTWLPSSKPRIFASHGHTFAPDALPPLEQGSVFLSGHTHIPTATRNADGVYLCNPGSMALPKNGYPPTYGYFSGTTFQVITDEGDVFLEIECR